MGTPRSRTDQATLIQIADTPDIMPTVTGDDPNATERASEPSHDQIARRAYQLFEKRGGAHGHELEDWFRAERELTD